MPATIAAAGEQAARRFIDFFTANIRNPQAYLTDVIGRIADQPIQKIDDLLPWRWKP